MIVTAYNNGAHSRNGSGYGFRVSVTDRDLHFKPEWDAILLELEGEEQPFEVVINKDSFWGDDCRELMSKAIGMWLRQRGLAPWPKGNPPRFVLDPVEENRFSVSKAQKQAGGKKI
jgi:hypothetical protein